MTVSRFAMGVAANAICCRVVNSECDSGTNQNAQFHRARRLLLAARETGQRRAIQHK
jgi:hypothetical protein